MALDLARQVLTGQVDRVAHVVRALAGPEGHALEVERDLRDLRIADRRIALLLELHLHLRQRRYLPRDLLELLLDLRPEVVVDRNVAPLHLDAHPSPSVSQFAKQPAGRLRTLRVSLMVVPAAHRAKVRA